MKAALRGVSGPGTGVQIALDRGDRISVGRNATCTVSIPTDSSLSGRHFEITVIEGQILLRDLGSSNGTFIDGIRVREYLLRDGESVLAGRSVFQVNFNATEVPTVVDVLSNRPEPLYAVLDTARDPAIYPLLLTSGASYYSLYAGKSALELEAVAPYLVSLPPRCELLQTLVAKGWGKSWGIFLTSNQPAETIWHELRRSLMVKLEETQEFVYFRFYDPRVLRSFLAMADARQMVELTGTMTSLLVEDEDAAFLLRFHSFSTVCALEKLEVRPFNSPAAAHNTQDSLAATTLIERVR